MVKGFRLKKDKTESSADSRDVDFSKLDGEDTPVNAAAKEASNGAAEASEEKSASGSPEIAALKAECAAARAEVRESMEKYLRSLADFENYKKRAIKERSELLKYQGENLVVDLLEVADNFERALESADTNPEQFKSGVKLIHKMLSDVLTKHGINAESAIGKPFEPQKHHALSQVTSTEVPAGSIVSELKKAYFYKDKLIRIADVVVSSGASDTAAGKESADSSTNLDNSTLTATEEKGADLADKSEGK